MLKSNYESILLPSVRIQIAKQNTENRMPQVTVKQKDQRCKNDLTLENILTCLRLKKKKNDVLNICRKCIK